MRFQKANGILPDAWKETIVVAIHKKAVNSKLVITDLQACMISVICKMLEAIIKEHNIINHLLTHNLLSDYHSMAFVLVDRARPNYLEPEYSNGEPRVASLDFQKAFYKVTHEHLLAKVESFGITSCLLS